MPDTSTILSLPYILPAQAQKHVTHNEALRQLDVIVQLAVTARNLATPPASPVQGDRYIVAAAPTGAWSGKVGQIALFEGGAWQFFAPVAGWTAWIAAESTLASYNGSLWVTLADSPQRFSQIGVSAAADATNRQSVSSPATLLNHAGAGHQLKINKAIATDTASLMFQTSFSGRAEMGTAGNDDFAIKVSADGSAYVTGLSIAGSSGQVTLPAALRLGGQAADPVSPSNGMIWLNSTTGEIKMRSNGVSIVVASVNGVANAQLAQMAAATFKGRDTGAGVPQDLTAAQAAAILPVVTSTARGLAPASGGGSANFLRADGTWAAPSLSSLPALGITATAAQINPLSNAFDNAILGAGVTGNLAIGANDFANTGVWPSSTTMNGLTATKTFGSDAQGPFADVRVTGTATGIVQSNFYAADTSRTPATIGETFTASAIVERIAGTLTGVVGISTGVVWETAPGTFIGIQTANYGTAAAPTLITATRTIPSGNQVRTYLSIEVTNGATIDVTYRIRGLQLDKSAARIAYPFKALSPAEARTAMGVQGAGNLLINGTGRINQRGYVSGAATTAANQFTLDRWFVVTSGQNLTFTGTVAGYTMTAPAGGVSQVIEGANITGWTYCLSWIGNATATVNGVAVANGGLVSLTAGANATVRFSGGTFTQAQLELGTVPTPYQRLDISEQLRLCERYYERQSYDVPASGQHTPTGYWRTRKRATPTITILSYQAGSGGGVGVQTADPTGAFRPSSFAASGTIVLIEGNAELTA